MLASFDTSTANYGSVARQWRRNEFESWTLLTSFLELLCFLSQRLWHLRLFLFDLNSSVAGMPLSEIRYKVSRFGSKKVEIAHDPLQQAIAIENRLQKGCVSAMLLSILISVKTPP